MGKAFSSLPQHATESAVRVFGNHEIEEINLIFGRLSHLPPIPMKNKSSSRAIDESTFGDYFSYPGVLRKQIFQIFDSNNDGYIDRDEFMCGLAMCCRGSLEEKMQFIFSMFDLSNDGFVDRSELKKCLESTAFASYSLLQALALEEGLMDSADANTSISTAEFTEDIANMVEDAFSMCDLDHNQKLSIYEFKRWLLDTPEVTGIIYSVFEMRKHASVDMVNQEFDEERKSIAISRQTTRLKAINHTIELLKKENFEYNSSIKRIRKEIIILQAQLKTNEELRAKELAV